MKIPKSISLDKKLFNQLRQLDDFPKLWHFFDEHGNRKCQHGVVLFLLGANKKGIYINAERLKAGAGGWGCQYMPSIGRSEMARAYVELIKRKTIPGAFAIVHPQDVRFPISNDRWGLDWGAEAEKHINRAYIRIGRDVENRMAFITDGLKDAPTIYPISLKLV